MSDGLTFFGGKLLMKSNTFEEGAVITTAHTESTSGDRPMAAIIAGFLVLILSLIYIS